MYRAVKTQEDAEKRIWSARVLGKYWLLQLPEAALLLLILLLLQAWLEFPAWITWSLVGLWVAKDAALYPLVWRSFDSGYPATIHSLDGELGVAAERLDPTGYVRVRGELWHAELERGARPVEKDEAVQIKATRDLTLIVTAAGDARES
jgi:membrane protein implicated in regulation of membrane protease activity